MSQGSGEDDPSNQIHFVYTAPNPNPDLYLCYYNPYIYLAQLFTNFVSAIIIMQLASVDLSFDDGEAVYRNILPFQHLLKGCSFSAKFLPKYL